MLHFLNFDEDAKTAKTAETTDLYAAFEPSSSNRRIINAALAVSSLHPINT
jgi:hypothetical protein